jgi:hypothetical protein
MERRRAIDLWEEWRFSRLWPIIPIVPGAGLIASADGQHRPRGVVMGAFNCRRPARTESESTHVPQ